MNEQEIFVHALKQPDANARRGFLERACDGDSELRNRVTILLRAYDGAGEFLESPAAGSVATLDHPLAAAAEMPGTIIGRYKLLEQIGEGGMGVVYVAEQTEPVRRRVALKIIKPGMDTKQVIARFEAERQALAMMDHPHIARVLDAGTTDQGRPYFVMELVKGLPITEYCDQAKLSPRQRLELFIDVCHAVQHAHQKGIIHRDLKPSNVMITLHDGTPVVKVIDFGVAKAVGQQLTERTVYTALAQLVGTPLYMSPEQAELSGLDVDTRSDVYSLGVLLYELLTGTTPFEKERLKSVGFDEMRRIIREEEPETVSQRLSRTRRTGTGELGPGARSRAFAASAPAPNPQPLAPRVSELDWIVARALEKDRKRRYESASAFAADLQRYLSDEPVLACPPTTMYRFQKFARKHKAALTTAAAIAICLILGTTMSAWQAVRATTAEAQAKTNAAQAQDKANEATDQRDEAQRQRDEVRALNQRLQHTLYVADMNLARHAWDEGSTDRTLSLLEQHRHKDGEADLRAFEWHYLYRLFKTDLLTLKGHTGGVWSVEFSPDGKRLASASDDQTIKLWDAQTGHEIRTIKGHTAPVWSVAFNPAGNRLASASYDQTIKVWDAQSGQPVFTCMGHSRPVLSVAFSPDGARLASGSTDKTVKLWDARTGDELFTFKGYENGIGHVVFSPGSKKLAAAFSDGSIKVWDAQTHQELLSLKNSSYGGVAFSPDGKQLVSRGKLWDAETGQQLMALDRNTDAFRGGTFSPDGNRVATALRDDKTVKVWDAKTGKELFSRRGHTGRVIGLVFSPDGNRLASSSADGTVKIWDATTGPEDRALIGRDVTGSIIYSPDGSLIASPSKDDTIQLLDAESGRQLLTSKGHTGRVTGVAFSPDGKRLASASWDKTLKVWDVQTGKELLTCTGHTSFVRSVAFSPDGKRLASSANSGEAKLWDAETGEEVRFFMGHTADLVGSIVFSPDGKRVASAAADATVKVWDAKTAAELLTLKGHTYNVATVAFSPDGKRLASGGWEGTVKIWDADSGKELLLLNGHTKPVNQVTYSPDGKRLASSGGGIVKLWDAQTGEEVLTLKDAGGGVTFRPDGYRLATLVAPGKVKIYDATPLPNP